VSDHYRRVAPLAKILAQVEDVSAEGLGPLDQLHTGGLAASRMLAKLAGISRDEVVLDVGCGVGGSARLLASEFGAQVTAVDLSPEYVEIGRALSQKSGIPVTFECANALDLPFPSGTFDVVWTQHAATNISDKPRLYRELQRVLRAGGRLAFHDLLVGQTPGPLHMPLPFADTPEESFLSEATELRELLQKLGFQELAWRDRTAPTIVFFNNLPLPDLRSQSLGLHLLLGPDFATMVANIRRNMFEGRLNAAMGVYAAGSGPSA
jgi:SAM-dependent methyltransferase